MTRYHNIYTNGAAIFWTSSIVDRVPILRSPTAARRLVEIIDECRTRYGVKVAGYTIMPDHFHILVWAEDVERAKLFITQVLRRSSAALAAMTDAACGLGDARARMWSDVFHSKAAGKSAVRVWKERGRAFPVDTREVMLQKLTYIHDNPVRAGLVEHAEDWLFSSAAWFSRKQGLIAIDDLE